MSISRETANQVINRLQVIMAFIEQRNAPQAMEAVQNLGAFVNLQVQLTEQIESSGTPRRT